MVGAAPSRACVNPPTWWWILVVVEAATLAVVIPRLWRAARGGRRLQRGEATAVRISVIIPARNEASRIAQCLAPLHNAPGIYEIIVVDDESSDDTALIARNHGATVVDGKPLPEGWVGKIWALEQGITAATGDVVVTLDADARPSAELPQAAVRALVESGASLATVAPRFRTTSRSSQWLHVAMLTSLVYRHGAGSGRATKDAVANGQCMVFRRADAVDNGWCERVRGSIIEDVALVRMLVAEGKQVEMFDGTSLLTVQMFDGFADTWRGWGRSLSLTGVDSRRRQAGDAAITAVSVVAPLWLVFGGVATPLTMLLFAVRLGTLIGARRAYERAGVGYWLSPVADLLAWVVVLRGTVAPSRQWRGRQY